ncbi:MULTISPECIES: aminotransferase class III-fold pyridoxal phosphate-dependent enzyme [unclassified Brenneria]|uniref:aminotransferase class III-fold pyridoxal phosphate-dependent enzyme n=1 Tax=unclassified Brenneria TaxID=2634434 RepID=UPI0018F0C8DA|nr:aminotransferase class III-fold pyridoxal phosphate-dependent enzyme [Brenneria sp. L3-3C-1]MBJ7221041.1 aminotransferase class III-fold pyridoxal phosphate-dependent enzyme [Brenneria sp. L3-3C-1]MEE3642282.1 aminotransferase class III-fold pyridoxal phosphate-dependent enzyme [Brenneria sp. L3_3C_1]
MSKQQEDASKLINDNFWIPFTPNGDFHQDPKLFTGAKGVYYQDAAGNRVLDGASGLFTSALGHGRPEIAEAVYQQLLTLDYTSSFYRSHPLAFKTAHELAKILPPRLDRIFFANSGSEAIDSALKVALAYQRARKQGSRTLFISRERAYHGVNFGGVALSGLTNNRRQFAGSWPQVIHLRHTWLEENRYSRGQPEHGAYLADDLQRLIELHGAENVAACVIEPIAGSTGVLVPPKGYLERIRQLCDRYDILLILDEVICGFGRTGKAFASQTFNIRPDIITLAKALTNGTQPMAAVAVDRRIYDEIINAADELSIEFFHGYTWSAHPAACAAALSTLRLYQTDDAFAKSDALSPYFLDKLFELQRIPVITDIRGFGLLGGIDVRPAEKPGLRGYRLQKKLFEQGLHLKSTGDSLIIAPILLSTRGQIDELFAILQRVLSEEQ